MKNLLVFVETKANPIFIIIVSLWKKYTILKTFILSFNIKYFLKV